MNYIISNFLFTFNTTIFVYFNRYRGQDSALYFVKLVP
jgi:hypothetical protein